jgi:hypothetical protein
MFAAGKPHQEQGKAGALGRPVPQKAPGMLHDGRSNPDAREMIATPQGEQKAAYRSLGRAWNAYKRRRFAFLRLAFFLS